MKRRIDVQTGTVVALCIVVAGTALGMVFVTTSPDGSLDLENIRRGAVCGMAIAVIWIGCIPLLNEALQRKR
jgi:hypothetical protein